MKVLIISDDPNSAELLTLILRQAGLMAVTTNRTDGEGVLAAYAKEVPEMIFIDASTPALDLLDICRTLRLETIAPILVLSPHTEEEYILQAFDLGIDEYLPKPISPKLLMAKANALLRRARSVPLASISSLRAGGVELSPERRTVRWPQRPETHLTNLEFRLLYCLMSNQGQVVPTKTIIEKVWGYSGEGDYQLVKGLVRRLRCKIEADPSEPHYVQTVAGVGYTFSPPLEEQ